MKSTFRYFKINQSPRT